MSTTVKLIGSSYQTDTGGSVSSASNMYNYVSNGDPAHFWTATYNYIKMILNGFDFSVIPNNAVIEAVEYKIKIGEASNNNYGTVQLKGAKNSNPASEEVTLASKSITTYTITPTVDFDTIREYGSSFGFCIKANYTDADIRVYGAEIDVTYTIPPSVNKVDYIKDGVLRTLIDLTGDDTLPEDVTAGKLFHLANGEQATGTASGGLEYETGTWSPSSNVRKGTITLSKTHDTPPTFFCVWVSNGAGNVSSGMISFEAVDFIDINSTTMAYTWYGDVRGYYKTSSGSPISYGHRIDYGYSNSGSSSTSYYRYFADESNIYPYATSASYPWQSNKVYNWIAVWLPKV